MGGLLLQYVIAVLLFFQDLSNGLTLIPNKHSEASGIKKTTIEDFSLGFVGNMHLGERSEDLKKVTSPISKPDFCQ